MRSCSLRHDTATTRPAPRVQEQEAQWKARLTDAEAAASASADALRAGLHARIDAVHARMQALVAAEAARERRRAALADEVLATACCPLHSPVSRYVIQD
jgi:hypothetical protein